MTRRELTFVASDVAPIGGMERVAYEIAQRLLARGWSLTVIARSCALEPGPHLRFHRIAAPPKPVSVALALSWIHGSWLLRRHRRGLVQTNNAVVANRVDVVNVHFCEAAYRERVGVSRSSRPTLLFRLNSLVASSIDLLAERWAYRRGRVRALACVSEGVGAEVAAAFPAVADAVRTIPNGVDRARFAPDPAAPAALREELGLAEDDRIALFVGGDWHRKGLRHAIAALAEAPGWHLVVVGPGDADAFRRLAGEHGVAARVHFTGRRPDPRPYFAGADVLVFPTAYEAFSLVTLEAVASGLPVIMPAVNGSELVQTGRNGFITPADPALVGANLRRLRQDPVMLGAMQRAARERSEDFDWERVTDAYEALYAELAAS